MDSFEPLRLSAELLSSSRVYKLKCYHHVVSFYSNYLIRTVIVVTQQGGQALGFKLCSWDRFNQTLDILKQ